jgi:hypothetical protein
MTTDENLIGYLLEALDSEEQDAVASEIHANPAAATRLAQLRLALAPLSVERENTPAPQPDLALRTISRLAAHLANHEPPQSVESDHGTLVAVAKAMETEYSVPEEDLLAFPSVPPPMLRRAPREEPETRAVGGRFRPDLIVACGIALFAGGLIFSAVGKLRAQNQVLVCQSNLHTLHNGLAGYADTHFGKYPQIGTETNPTADTFVNALTEAGQVPPGFRACCPADPTVTGTSPASTPVGYTYSLGYRTPTGGLNGVHRSADGGEHDLLPIVADYPTASAAPVAGPLCPHAVGMNVLCAGGNVRHTTSPLIGPNGDDIYRNIFGQVAAGANHDDVVLGRPGDKP